MNLDAVQSPHKAAMEHAAAEARKAGDPTAARALYRLAMEAELAAATMTTIQPTRAILHRAAAPGVRRARSHAPPGL